MSTTIDEKIVSLQFDNSKFEQNVKTSMSTLDKLKHAFKLDGVSKGLNGVQKSVNSLDFSNVENMACKSGFHIQDVWLKMSSVFEYQIARKLTSTLTDLAKAFTIDPVKSGLNEYELKMNSVQTIMMSTGESVETVNKYLNELNKYSDETIYSFQDMTSNIGKFTNAGVKLEDAVLAIKGVSNEAAVSGANANEASRAMYNFAQALSAGYVKLIDWKSIENANMATVEFKTQLLESAVACGTLTKAEDGMYRTTKGTLISATHDFNDSLQQQWMTTDVLVQTLKDYADENTEIGAKAKKAATQVKTFSQMMDVLKETAQSGWAQTWELIFGDLDKAKDLFTGLTDYFSNIIDKFSSFRNGILEKVLGNNDMTSKFNSLKEMIGGTTTALRDYGDVVDQVINGEFATGEERWKALTEAGYNWARVQNLVNEKLGSSVVHLEDLEEAQGGAAKSITDLSDAELIACGLTEEEVQQLRVLAIESEKTGKSIEELINAAAKPDGRTLLLESLGNIGKGLIEIFKQVGVAWNEMFPNTKDNIANGLYTAIEALHKFSEAIIQNGEFTEEFKVKMDQIKRILKGVFSAFDMVRSILSVGFKLAMNVLCKLLGMANVDILELLARVGDVIVKFRDWTKTNDILGKSANVIVFAINKIVGVLKTAYSAVKKFYNTIMEIPAVKDFISKFTSGVSDLYNTGKFTIEGFANGLKDGTLTIPKILFDLGKKVLSSICSVLGIQSPSKETYKLGEFTVMGFVNGIKDFIKGIDWGAIFTAGITVGLTKAVIDLATVLKNFSKFSGGLGSTLEGVGEVLTGTGKILNKSAKSISKVIKSFSKVVKSFSKVLSSLAFSTNAKAIKNITESLAILIGMVIALALTIKLLGDDGIKNLWISVGIVTALSAVLVGLSFALSKMGGVNVDLKKGIFSAKGMNTTLISLGVSLLAITAAITILGKIDKATLDQGLTGLGSIVAMLGAMAIIFGTFVKGKSAQNIGEFGKFIKKLSISLLLLCGVIKIIGNLSYHEIKTGEKAIGAFIVFVGSLALITKLTGKNTDKLAKMLTKMSISFLLMSAAIKILGTLSAGDIVKGVIVIKGFIGAITLLALITKIVKEPVIEGLGKTLLAMSASMLIMAATIKLVGTLSASDIQKGIVAIIAFTGIVSLLTMITKLAGKDAPKIASTLLAMSLSIGILAAVAAALSFIKTENLFKGIVAVQMLSICVALMASTAKKANDSKASLIAITAAIVALAASVAVLSFIKPEKLAAATVAIGSLVLSFAVMAGQASKVQNGLGPLIVLATTIGILAGAIYALSYLPVEKSLVSAGVLSLVILSMAGACKLLSASKSAVLDSLKVAAALLLLCIPMAAIVGILYLMQGIKDAAKNAIILAGVLVTMTGVFALLGLLSPLIGPGVLAVLEIGALLVALGALNKYVPEVREFVEESLPLLKLFGEGIGQFLGGIVTGVIDAMDLSGLTKLADQLTDFSEHLKPFLDNMKGVDPDSLTGVKTLTDIILSLTKANIIDSIGSFITGGSSLSKFADELEDFGPSLNAFSKSIPDVDVNRIEVAAKATKMLTDMADSVPNEGGWLGAIIGENSLAAFGEELVKFGPNLAKFSNSLPSNMDTDKISAAASATKTLTSMAASVPNSGGWLGAIVGENSLATFGEELAKFGPSLTKFSNSLPKDLDAGKIKSAASATKALTSMADSVPNEGGWVGAIVGDNSLAKFGEELAKFGPSLASFARSTATVKVEAVKQSSDATVALAEMVNSLKDIDYKKVKDFPTEIVNVGASVSGYSNAVVDVNSTAVRNSISATRDIATMIESLKNVEYSSITNFPASIVNMGTRISNYSAAVNGVNQSKVSESTKSIICLSTCLSNLGNIDAGNVSAFSSAINELATVDMSAVIAAFDTAGAKAITSGVDIIKNLGIGMEQQSSGVSKTAETIVSGVLKAIDSKISSFTSKGKKFITNLANGMKDAKSKVSKNAESIINDTISIFDGVKDTFHTIGGYISEGLASGIRDSSGEATAAARELANSVEEIARDALKINSPSKIFIGIGSGIPEGMSEGITDGTSSVLASVRKLCIKTAAAGADAMAKSNSQISDSTLANATTMVQKYAESLYLSSDSYKNEQKSAKSNLEAIEKYNEERIRNARNLAIELGKRSEYDDGSFDAIAAAKSEIEELSNSESSLTEAQEKRKSMLESYINIEDGYISSIANEKAVYQSNISTIAETESELDSLKQEEISLREEREKAAKALSDEENAQASRMESLTKDSEELSKANENLTNESSILSTLIEKWNSLGDEDSTAKSGLLSLIKSAGVEVESVEDVVTALTDKLNINTELISSNKKKLAQNEEEIKATDKVSEATENLNTIDEKLIKNELDQAKLRDKLIDKQKKYAEEVKKAYEDMYNVISTKVTDFVSITNASYDSHITDFFEEFTQIDTEDLKTPYDILIAMQSQVDGVKKWQEDLATLSGKGISEGLLSYIKELGPSAVNELQAFMAMTEEELEQANTWYAAKYKISGTELLNSYKEQAVIAKEWANNIELVVLSGFDENLVKEIVGMGIEEGNAFMDALLSMDESEISEFNKAREEALKLPDEVANSVYASMVAAGSESAEEYRKAILEVLGSDSSGQALTDTITGTVNDASTASTETVTSSGYSIGENYVDGMVAGINENANKVAAAAAALASIAEVSTQDEAEIHSPSRVFMKLGKWIPEGFAAGIKENLGIVDNVSETMAAKLCESTKNAMSKVTDIAKGNYETTSTIRPVVDMSNLTGVNYKLSSTINTDVGKPVDSLSKLVSDAQAEIYDSNSKVIEAVHALRSDLSSMYAEDSQEIALYVDSKKLASSIAKPMDRQLNILSRRGAYV